jgi:hypothetical protein
MTLLLDHRPINVPTGTQEFGPANVPSTVTSFGVRLARCTTATPTFWPNASTTVNASLLLSNDGGATYPRGAGGFTGAGGIIKVQGVEAPESNMFGGVSAPLGAGWQIKAVITVTGGPLVSQLTVEVT